MYYNFKDRLNLTSEESILVKRLSKVDSELSKLTSKHNYDVKFYRSGNVSVTDTGKLSVLVKRLTKIHKWVEVNTYHRTSDTVYRFLWKMIDNEIDVEIELSETKEDMIEVKGVLGSRSRIVGRLPDDIYENVKDKILEAELDFITSPNDLNISLYEVSYTTIEFDDIPQLKNKVINKNEKDYKVGREESLRNLLVVINKYLKLKE